MKSALERRWSLLVPKTPVIRFSLSKFVEIVWIEVRIAVVS